LLLQISLLLLFAVANIAAAIVCCCKYRCCYCLLLQISLLLFFAGYEHYLMLAASVCARCGQGFSNRQQLGAHVRCCRAAAAAASDDDAADLFSADNTQVIATPTPTVPQRQISLYTLCRREKSPWGTVTPSDVTFDTQAGVQASVFSRDYRPLQELWSEHVQKARYTTKTCKNVEICSV
jgi:hypothetical protein